MPHEIADRIPEILRAAPNSRMVGSQLALQLRKFGYSSKHHGRLRDLIEQHVPEVVRIAQSGKDWVYVLRTPEGCITPAVLADTSSPGKITPAEAREIWDAYARPSGNLRLFVEPQSVSFHVISPREPIPGDRWIEIHPCSLADFQSIAYDWVRNIADPVQKQNLTESLLGGSGPQSPFLAKVRDLNLKDDWERRRRSGILDRLEASLDSAGFPNARGWIIGLHQALEKPVSTSPRISPAASSLRRLLISAIRKMPERELRDLQIPAGYLFDAIRDE
jgi:hypothetical protein